jgi:hypothetical protein
MWNMKEKTTIYLPEELKNMLADNSYTRNYHRLAFFLLSLPIVSLAICALLACFYEKNSFLSIMVFSVFFINFLLQLFYIKYYLVIESKRTPDVTKWIELHYKYLQYLEAEKSKQQSPMMY